MSPAAAAADALSTKPTITVGSSTQVSRDLSEFMNPRSLTSRASSTTSAVATIAAPAILSAENAKVQPVDSLLSVLKRPTIIDDLKELDAFLEGKFGLMTDMFNTNQTTTNQWWQMNEKIASTFPKILAQEVNAFRTLLSMQITEVYRECVDLHRAIIDFAEFQDQGHAIPDKGLQTTAAKTMTRALMITFAKKQATLPVVETLVVNDAWRKHATQFLSKCHQCNLLSKEKVAQVTDATVVLFEGIVRFLWMLACRVPKWLMTTPTLSELVDTSKMATDDFALG
jgi:hypothetical protein